MADGMTNRLRVKMLTARESDRTADYYRWVDDWTPDRYGRASRTLRQANEQTVSPSSRPAGGTGTGTSAPQMAQWTVFGR